MKCLSTLCHVPYTVTYLPNKKISVTYFAVFSRSDGIGNVHFTMTGSASSLGVILADTIESARNKAEANLQLNARNRIDDKIPHFFAEFTATAFWRGDKKVGIASSATATSTATATDYETAFKIATMHATKIANNKAEEVGNRLENNKIELIHDTERTVQRAEINYINQQLDESSQSLIVRESRIVSTLSEAMASQIEDERSSAVDRESTIVTTINEAMASQIEDERSRAVDRESTIVTTINEAMASQIVEELSRDTTMESRIVSTLSEVIASQIEDERSRAVDRESTIITTINEVMASQIEEEVARAKASESEILATMNGAIADMHFHINDLHEIKALSENENTIPLSELQHVLFRRNASGNVELYANDLIQTFNTIDINGIVLDCVDERMSGEIRNKLTDGFLQKLMTQHDGKFASNVQSLPVVELIFSSSNDELIYSTILEKNDLTREVVVNILTTLISSLVNQQIISIRLPKKYQSYKQALTVAHEIVYSSLISDEISNLRENYMITENKLMMIYAYMLTNTINAISKITNQSKNKAIEMLSTSMISNYRRGIATDLYMTNDDILYSLVDHPTDNTLSEIANLVKRNTQLQKLNDLIEFDEVRSAAWKIVTNT